MTFFKKIKTIFIKNKSPDVNIKSSSALNYGIMSTNTTPFSANFSAGYNPGRAENSKFVQADTTQPVYDGYPTNEGFGKFVQLAHIIPSLDAVDFTKGYNPGVAENGKFVQLDLDDSIDFPEKKFGHHKFAVLTYIVNPDSLQLQGGTLSGSLNLSGYDIFNAGNIFTENLFSDYIETTCGNSDQWCSAYTQMNVLSDEWSGAVIVTEYLSATFIEASCGNSDDWCSVYTQVNLLSDDWNNDFDGTLLEQTSSFWDSAYTQVNLLSSNWNDLFDSTLIEQTSGNWNSAYTQVNNLSDTWEDHFDSTLLEQTSGNWDSAYDQVLANSSFWSQHVDITELQQTSGDWNSVYSNVNTLSGDWESVYSQVLANSAFWSQHVDLTELQETSGDWNSAYTQVNNLSDDWSDHFDETLLEQTSGNWDSVYDQVLANSSFWSQHVDLTLLQQTSGDWNSVYNNVNGLSGDWDSVYTQVNTLSDSWDGDFCNEIVHLNEISACNQTLSVTGDVTVDGDLFAGDINASSTLYVSDQLVGVNTETPNEALTVNGNLSSNGIVFSECGDSGDWCSVYSQVLANSSFWSQHVDLTLLQQTSGDWNSVYNNVNELSGDWESVYEQVLANSAFWSQHVDLTELQETSGDWNSAYTQLNDLSANWELTYQNAITAVNGDSFITAIENNNAVSLTLEPLSGEDISFDSSTSPLTSDNVQDAIVETLTLAQSGGEVNDGVNIGSGEGVYFDKQGLLLRFKSLVSNSDYISLSSNNQEIAILDSLSANEWNSVYSQVLANSSFWNQHSDLTELQETSASWNSSYTQVNNLSDVWGDHFDSTLIEQTSSNWDSVYDQVLANSAFWSQHVDLTELQEASGDWNSVYDQVNVLSGDWESVYEQVLANSSFWSQHVDLTELQETSGDWNSSYTTVQLNSSDWGDHFDSTLLEQTSGNWDSVYDQVLANSAFWSQHVDLTELQQTSGDWNSVYSQVNVLSGDWESVYEQVLANSAFWSQHVDLTELQQTSGDWNSSYTTVQLNSSDWGDHFDSTLIEETSGDWNSVYDQVLANSAFWSQHVDLTELQQTSADWNSVYNNVNELSGDWESVYSQVLANSSFWSQHVDLTELQEASGDWNSVYDQVNVLSGDWESVYEQVLANSSFWSQHVDLTELQETSGDWNSAYTQVNTLSDLWSDHFDSTLIEQTSGNWDSVYDQVLTNSSFWSQHVDLTELQETSGDWNSAYSQLNDLSANWEVTYQNAITAVNGDSFITAIENNNVVSLTLEPLSADDITFDPSTSPLTSTDVQGAIEETLTLAQSGGEVNAGVNLGAGEFVYAGKAGLLLQFKSLVSNSDYISLSSNNQEIAILDSLSANEWNSVYNQVLSNSSFWNQHADLTDLQETSANWNSSYTQVNNLSDVWGDHFDSTLIEQTSGNWDSVYSQVLANSSFWSQHVDLTELQETSGDWNSAYTQVNNLSDNWSDHFDSTLIEQTSGDWNSSYTTVNDNSSNWGPNFPESISVAGCVSADCIKPFTTITTPISVYSGIHMVSGGTGIEMENAPIINMSYVDWNLNQDILPQEGRLSWNETDGTLDLGLAGGNVNLQIGQEEVVRVKNVNGLISNGNAVYITSADGPAGRPTVGLANAINIETSDYVLGLATEDIASNQQGYITTHGLVRDIDTSNIPTGERVYLDTTNGGLVSAVPAHPNGAVLIGYCINGLSLNNGVVYVNPEKLYDLTELHDVNITAPASGDIITYSTALSGWENINNVSDFIQGIPDSLNSFNVIETQTNTTFTLSNSSGIVLVDATAGDATVNLPNAVGNNGRRYTVKKVDSTNNTVTLSANTNIDGQDTFIIRQQYDAIEFMSNNVQWWII